MTDNISIKGGLKWLLVAVTCPCHVPIWIALLGSTAAGAWLASNMLLAIILSTGLFIASFVWAGRGLSGLSRGEKPGRTAWTEGEAGYGVERESHSSGTTRIDSGRYSGFRGLGGLS